MRPKDLLKFAHDESLRRIDTFEDKRLQEEYRALRERARGLLTRIGHFVDNESWTEDTYENRWLADEHKAVNGKLKTITQWACIEFEADEDFQKLVPEGLRVIIRVFVTMRDVYHLEHDGNWYLSEDSASLDTVTSLRCETTYAEGGEEVDPFKEDPIDPFEHMESLCERINYRYPILTEELLEGGDPACRAANRLSMLEFQVKDYNDPTQLAKGIHGALDEFESRMRFLTN